MFENLSGRLGKIFDRLKRHGVLSDSDLQDTMREVRIALLEADVALSVVKHFIDQVKTRAIGQEVIRSITPGQMVVKIVHDVLVETLGEEVELTLTKSHPTVILLVGLQGSGKTTTAAKIGLRLQSCERRKVLLTSLDTRRPAAQEQLTILGHQLNIAVSAIVSQQENPVEIAKNSLQRCHQDGFDVVILDTAGRLHIDHTLLTELSEIGRVVVPDETLLVADATIGQDAVNIATAFNKYVHLTGVVLTKVDSDARGGAALSIRCVTGLPVKLLGIGEKLDALENFRPARLAKSILGMGDIVSFVERATTALRKEETEHIATRLLDGRFDLNDLLLQLRQVRKMGDLKGLVSLIPGFSRTSKQLIGSHIDSKFLLHQEAIILSMTQEERCRPELIKASRKRRIAAGCGLTVQAVNKLLKQHQQMAQVVKGLQKLDSKGGMLRNLLGKQSGLSHALEQLLSDSSSGEEKNRPVFRGRRHK